MLSAGNRAVHRSLHSIHLSFNKKIRSGRVSQAVNVFISAAELDSLTHCWSLKWQSLRTAVFGPRVVKEESAQCLVQLLCWSCTRIEHSAKIRSVTTARGLPLETNVFTQAAKYGLLQRVTHCTYSAKTLVQIPQEHRGSGCYANRRESLCKPNPANVTSDRSSCRHVQHSHSFYLMQKEPLLQDGRGVEMRRFICYS